MNKGRSLKEQYPEYMMNVEKISFESIQNQAGECRHVWSSIILMEHYFLALKLNSMFCLDSSVNTVHLTAYSFTFFQTLYVNSTKATAPNIKYDPLVS